MKDIRQALIGILAVILSAAIVLGSLVIVLNETGQGAALGLGAGETEMALGLSTHLVKDPLLGASLLDQVKHTQLAIPTTAPSTSDTPTATLSPTRTPMGTTCPIPDGWLLIIVQPGETLEVLAARYQTTLQELAVGNCMTDMNLISSTSIYVPPAEGEVSNPKPPKTQCGPLPGWVIYIVKYKDTLYSLGLAFGVSVHQLQQANCMGSSILIRTGQQLWVPNVSTRTPAPAPVPPATPTLAPTLPTASETLLPTLLPEPSSTITATQPPSPTDTPTPTNSQPPLPVDTQTLTPTPTPT